jgi:hypothetical protein
MVPHGPSTLQTALVSAHNQDRYSPAGHGSRSLARRRRTLGSPSVLPVGSPHKVFGSCMRKAARLIPPAHSLPERQVYLSITFSIRMKRRLYMCWLAHFRGLEARDCYGVLRRIFLPRSPVNSAYSALRYPARSRSAHVRMGGLPLPASWTITCLGLPENSLSTESWPNMVVLDPRPSAFDFT